MKNIKKNLPFIITMLIFGIACAILTIFTIRYEPQYITFTPHEATAKATQELPREIPLININTATSTELMQLPGIGEVKARDIVAHRDRHGDFTGIEELMEVSGIGEGLFESIQEHVTVE